MKRLLVFALCAVLMATLALPVFADVIWIPSQSESSFFWNHQDECELEEKWYYANSPEGEVALRKEPDGKVKTRVDNGTVLYVSYTYQDWGMVDNPKGDGTYLWAALEDLVPVYDYRDFREDHPLTEKPGDMTWGEFTGETFLLWTYPGSGDWREMSIQWFDGESGLTEGQALEDYILGYYTDENGLVFGFIGYMFGHQDAFVCVSDPCNPDLPANPVLPELYPADAKQTNETDAGEQPEEPESLLLPGLMLVCLTVAVSAVLLLMLLKRKKREE